jgi:hypothetical protein
MIEHAPNTFEALCHDRFSQDVVHQYDNLLEKSNLLRLRIIDRHFITFFNIVFSAANCCPSVGIRLPARNPIILPRSVAPPVTALQLASTTSAVCKSTDILKCRV